MTDVEVDSTAGPGITWRSTARLVPRRAVSLALVTTITATVIGVARPAGADSVSSLQAKAAAVSASMLAEQLQIGGYQHQYEAAGARVQRDAQLVADTQRRIADDQARITSDRAKLAHEAVAIYVHAGASAANSAAPLLNGEDQTQIQHEYQQVVVGDVGVAVDNLRTAQGSLEADESTLVQREHADEAEQQAAAGFLSSSQSTEQQLQTEQSQVNGQLAQAVAERQAATEAVAAASVSAAQAAAATVTLAPTPDPGLPDPPLNAFLTCVVQAESGGNYGAVSPNGLYMGAFQFSQPTWNEAALLAGLPYLVGVAPNTASKAEQDTLAVALYNADGQQPWYDPCRNS